MENGLDGDVSSVRVAVRIRPLIGREKVERCDECVSVVEEESQIVMGKNRSFTYDYVFGKYAQQGDIWRCVDPLVKANFDGYNSTIFAYGQTGSGKTFTMGSGSSVHIPPEEYGIIPRVIMYMFDTIESKTLENPLFKAKLRIRFLEIYGEEIRDLLVTLGDSSGESKVTLRETEGGEVLVTGATEEVVRDADDCLRLLERGTLCRTTGSTLMNTHSSRSHAIFTVSMVQHIPISGSAATGAEAEAIGEGEFETRSCYFNFVDLAGSERQKRTQAEGKRLKEGIDINKGLLALGNVISALGDDKKRGKVHVPYRDSKLTRMLQDSLGGNSRTLMLTCVSPADVNFEETLNALKYANRARNIQNKAVVNRDEASAITLELRRQVQMLQAEVHRLRNPGLSDSELKFSTVGTNLIGMQMDFDSYSNLRSRAETAENEVARLTSELKRGKTQMDHMKEEMIAAQAERDYLRLCLDESGDAVAVTPEEREAKSNVLKENLRTIHELQEKLRSVERERDRAVMSYNESGLLGSAASALSAPFAVPSFIESDLKSGSELIEKAEKEIEMESARLKKLKGEESGDDVDAGSDGSGVGDGDGDGDVESSEEGMGVEASQEEADRQRVFQRRQQHLGESVQDLAHDISLKEQLVQNIRQAQENYEKMKNFYEQKMAQMAEEVRMAQMDRDKLIEEIQQIETKIREGDHSGGGARLDKLSKDLKTKEDELSALRKKQTEMNRFVNQKKKNEMQLRVLTAEISNMKRQKVDLVKKMQEERKRYEDEAKQRQKEILSLKRTQARDKQQIQRLGIQKDAQERVLKRKMEEITAAKLKLKHQQQLQAQAKRMNSAHGRNRNAPPSRADRDANWLSEEVKKRAEEQQKLEQFHREREAVAKELETLYAERDRVENQLRNSISSQSNIRDVLISPMKISPLNRRLSGRMEQQLTPEEEQLIYDLEERIESCHAQLEYKEEKISEIAEDGQNADGGALVKIESTQSLPEARTLLKMLFGMAVDVKKQDQRKEQEIEKLHVEMSDMARLLEQERSRTQQIKLSYEESLHKVVQGGLDTSSSPGRESSLDDRSRILLSVSEERNSVLRKKCDELENATREADEENQKLQKRLMREQSVLAESQEHIAYLEEQLTKLRAAGDRSRSSARGQEPRSEPTSISAHPMVSATPGRASGPVSWANEFDDDDDEEMTGDDEGGMVYDEDVDMKEGDVRGTSRGSREGKPPGSLKDRREFRVELDDMGDNLDSISLSERKRRDQITSRRRDVESDDGGDYQASYKEDSPTLGSDDSSSTTTSSSSIFVRLSNPSNFTGIHKNRVRESVTKREVLQSRSDRNRTRRMRDRGGAGSVTRPPRSGTPTSGGGAFGFKAPSKKASPVWEVLANIKRENETAEQSVGTPALRQPSSYGLERYREGSGENADASAAAGVMPPPAPQGDVYSRLAGQYTASAQSKRQTAPVARRQKSEDDSRSPSEKQTFRRIASDDDVSSYNTEQNAGDGSRMDDDHESGNYDPLLGGSSLVAQVHDDYRERLNNRTSSQSKIPTSSSGRF
uniref:Kinesin motor domain-containing protein n=1 Tax=Globisporangium ultimum (strain ATCC 200006 / CBS 805.95 / DAOM BR144) TaxID=431595 RepID=K3XBM4_GLOUD